jgi:hypothetical protein
VHYGICPVENEGKTKSCYFCNCYTFGTLIYLFYLDCVTPNILFEYNRNDIENIDADAVHWIESINES